MKQRSSRRPRLGLWIGISIAVILFGIWFFIRTYVVAAYVIPTGAMEKTIPLHSKVLINRLSYRPVKRGDILVFHFPVGDTVIDLPDYQSLRPYYDVIRDLGHGDADAGRQILKSHPNDYPLSIRPIEKREAYIKRCYAAPGDTFEMRDEVFYIDGHPQAWPAESETYFYVVTNSRSLDLATMKTRYSLDIANSDEVRYLDNPGTFDMLLTWKTRDKMLKDGFARQIIPLIDTSTDMVFPNNELHHWSRDAFGPIWIPKEGTSIQLTPQNYAIYERIIRTYEGNKLEIRDGKFYINDHEQSSYTFKMNYYWMLGDNLHGSQDSRYWGFVPEDHLIGKVEKIL